MDRKAVVKILKEAIDKEGSQKAFATKHGISPAYVNDVLHNRREFGPKLLDALGLDRKTEFSLKK